MRTINLTAAEIDALDPKHLVVSQWIGSDDILTESGDEIKARAHEFTDATTMSAILGDTLNNVSGNSFDIIALINGELVKVRNNFNA